MNLSIEVMGDSTKRPFEGDGWVFRLHLKNGTVRPPPDAEWFRSYTLQGVPNATVVHNTTFGVGDIIRADPYPGRAHPSFSGDTVIFHLEYHRDRASGPPDAGGCDIWFFEQEGRYVPDTALCDEVRIRDSA